MKKVLFLPLQHTSWEAMLHLAKEIKKTANVSFLIDTPYMLDKIDTLKEERIKYFTVLKDNNKYNETKQLSKIINIRDILKKILKKSTILIALIRWLRNRYQQSQRHIRKEYQHTYLSFKSKLQSLRELFEQEKFSVCVVYGDRHISGCELQLLKICQEKNIPAIIPPIALASGGEFLSFVRKSGQYSADHFPNLIKKFPNQVWYDPKSKKGVFFYTVGVMQALNDLKILPDNPWVLGGSASTKILVNGEFEKKRLIYQGCPQNKIIITGSPSHDKIYNLLLNKNAVKKMFAIKYKFSANKKILVVALPQWVENSPLSPEEAWDEINFLCKKVTNCDYTTLISLHPKMEYDNYKFVKEKYNLILVKERLDEILAIGDIFLSTFSSTVLWAVLCDIPALVIDYHSEQFSVFDGMKGVKIINNKNKIGIEINTLIKNNKIYKKQVENQKKTKIKLSTFDGHCTNRVVNSIINQEHRN